MGIAGHSRNRAETHFCGAAKCARGLLVESAAYVVCAVAALGIAVCELAGLRWSAALPVWVLGTHCVYSAHKLALARTRWSWWRWLQLALTAASAVLLATHLRAKRDWLEVAGVILALLAGCAYSYDLPLPFCPMRRLPLVKTLLPWSVAAGALTLLPMHEAGWQVDDPVRLVLAWLWVSSILLANILWCDLRDIKNDRAHSVISVPGLLGAEKTRWFILCLALVSLTAALRLSAVSALASFFSISLLAAIDPASMSRLAAELAVEGVLLVAAAPLAAAAILEIICRAA